MNAIENVEYDHSVRDEHEWLHELETPCYVFTPQTVLERYQQLKEQLGTALIVSLKANSEADLYVRCGHMFGDGVELASKGELDIVVGRGKCPRYLNNPSMNEEFMRAGIASRCNFILDNLDITRRFLGLAVGKNLGDVLLRINAGALLGSRTRRDWNDHFGMSPAEALQASELLLSAGIRVVGLHTFSGSYSFRCDAQPMREADSADLAFALAALADEVSHVVHAPIKFLNLGGGFPEGELDAEAMRRYRKRIAPLASKFQLAHESGRSIFSSCGVFVTRVMAVKNWEDRTIAVCDGGMSHNFLLAKTEAVIKTWQSPQLVRRETSMPTLAVPSEAPRPLLFVGSTCSRADVIGRIQSTTSVPQAGDLAVFSNCGAYNRSYSVSGFLSQKPARVYIRQA
jgi:diaminopimelate decarboxylase